jgi:hypothetical protein
MTLQSRFYPSSVLATICNCCSELSFSPVLCPTPLLPMGETLQDSLEFKCLNPSPPSHIPEVFPPFLFQIVSAGLPSVLLWMTWTPFSQYIIYLLTAVGLSPGGSTHLHTSNTRNNTNNNRITQITNNVEECGPCPVFASVYPGICLTTEEKARKNHSQGIYTKCSGMNLK